VICFTRARYSITRHTGSITRHTGSLVTAAAGDRVFPGKHGRVTFDVRETGDDFHISLAGRDGATRVNVDARLTDRLRGSVRPDAERHAEAAGQRGGPVLAVGEQVLGVRGREGGQNGDAGAPPPAGPC
jgi:hypothetical protein